MGKIFTFSGPRGVGKTSIMNDLRQECGVKTIIPYTTREPRPDEIEGKDYHFVTDHEFDAIRRTEGMFDVLTLRGRKYGTPLAEFDRALGISEGSVEGLRTINLAASSALELRKELGGTSVKSLFVLPECWSDIEQQMRDKGISEEQILERRAAEPTDLTMLPEFDRIIINQYQNRAAALQSVASYLSQISSIELTT
jgi:guanylate kinase